MFIFSIATLSIMIFYSAIIAVNVHKTLDRENAGKLLRVLFPSYFLTTAILSLIALIFSLIEKEFLNTMLFSCFFGFYNFKTISSPKNKYREGFTIIWRSDFKKEFRKASRFKCFNKYYSNPYSDNYCSNKL